MNNFECELHFPAPSAYSERDRCCTKVGESRDVDQSRRVVAHESKSANILPIFQYFKLIPQPRYLPFGGCFGGGCLIGGSGFRAGLGEPNNTRKPPPACNPPTVTSTGSAPAGVNDFLPFEYRRSSPTPTFLVNRHVMSTPAL